MWNQRDICVLSIQDQVRRRFTRNDRKHILKEHTETDAKDVHGTQ